MSSTVEDVVRPLRYIDWENVNAVEIAALAALGGLLEDRSLVRQALLALPERPELLRLCEHYGNLDKLVLYDDDWGIQLELQVFLAAYFDQPHNHRRSGATIVLQGGYRHHIFGNVTLDELVDPDSLKAVLVRRELVGSSYALHHSMMHSVATEPRTVSLAIQGPTAKDRFQVVDCSTGQSWWQRSPLQESPATTSWKRMSLDRVRDLTSLLCRWGVFDSGARLPHSGARDAT